MDEPQKFKIEIDGPILRAMQDLVRLGREQGVNEGARAVGRFIERVALPLCSNAATEREEARRHLLERSRNARTWMENR
jgi:hypothetical protein